MFKVSEAIDRSVVYKVITFVFVLVSLGNKNIFRYICPFIMLNLYLNAQD